MSNNVNKKSNASGSANSSRQQSVRKSSPGNSSGRQTHQQHNSKGNSSGSFSQNSSPTGGVARQPRTWATKQTSSIQAEYSQQQQQQQQKTFNPIYYEGSLQARMSGAPQNPPFFMQGSGGNVPGNPDEHSSPIFRFLSNPQHGGMKDFYGQQTPQENVVSEDDILAQALKGSVNSEPTRFNVVEAKNHLNNAFNKVIDEQKNNSGIKWFKEPKKTNIPAQDSVFITSLYEKLKNTTS